MQTEQRTCRREEGQVQEYTTSNLDPVAAVVADRLSTLQERTCLPLTHLFREVTSTQLYSHKCVKKNHTDRIRHRSILHHDENLC